MRQVVRDTMCDFIITSYMSKREAIRDRPGDNGVTPQTATNVVVIPVPVKQQPCMGSSPVETNSSRTAARPTPSRYVELG